MPVVTCVEGTNADLFAIALGMYVVPGSRIADVTYGRGVFWRNVDTHAYRLTATDIQSSGVDFRALPYKDQSFDAVVFDPPYMNNGRGAKASINKCYRNAGIVSHANLFALYLAGILEARRVLVKSGTLFVKCQPSVVDHKQHLTHVQLATVLPMLGFQIEDEFVLHQKSTPLMRHAAQQHARKNHSYLLIARRAR